MPRNRLYHEDFTGHHGDKERLLILFDTRIPGVAGQLHRARAVFQARAEIEAIGPDHFILTVRPRIPKAAT